MSRTAAGCNYQWDIADRVPQVVNVQVAEAGGLARASDRLLFALKLASGR